MPIENFIIEVYCAVCESLTQVIGGIRLRSRGFAPGLTDAEVLTMEFVGAYLGQAHDKGIWRYFSHHWREWFPKLGSRSNFVRQAANLWRIKDRLHQYWVACLGAQNSSVYLVDGFPIPVCHFRRAHFSTLFEGQAEYGYCASKDMTYYGFKGMLLTNDEGIIIEIAWVPANVDERDALDEFDWQGVMGMLLGDKGFIRPELQQRLAEQAIHLQTPKRSNMKETRSKKFLCWMKAQRRLVETVIGQLTERFSIQNNRARDLWHLASRIYRKVAAHTLCIWLRRNTNQPLALEKLMAA